MPIVTWSDDYLLKNERINDHHKLFFKILNKLYDGIVKNESNQSIDSVIVELEKYSTTHFVYEEIYMLDISYGHMKDHISQHDIFRSKIKELKSAYSSNSIEAKLKLVAFLKEWTLGHIIEEDQRLAEWQDVSRASSRAERL